jgi:hypothetical protein
MKLLSLKYLTVVLIVFCLQLPGCVLLITGERGVVKCAQSKTVFDNPPAKNKYGLEMSPSGPKPAEHAEKVETAVIPGPDSNHKGARHFRSFFPQIKAYKVRESSLSEHFSKLLSTKMHKNPLINILRI